MQTIYFTNSLAEAHFIRGLLENEGIRALVQNEGIFGVLGEAPFSERPSVAVADEDLERASKVVDEYARVNRGEAPADEESEE